MPAVLSSANLPSSQPEPFGILGMESCAHNGNRVDFDPGAFEYQIEVKGHRLAWSRALRCPCAPINIQSEQPDPNCTLCEGDGWTYFGPTDAQDLRTEQFSAVQKTLVRHYNSFVIRGLLLGIGKSDTPWDKIGSWRSGNASLTVRYQNRIGFMDRFVNLDAQLVFTEVVLMPESGSRTLPTRYLVTGAVHIVRSAASVYAQGRDYEVRDGRIVFAAGKAPPPKTRISAHYVTFPTWIVQDIPNAVRMTNLAAGRPQVSPQGAIAQMPLRGTVRLEFLPPMGLSAEVEQ